MTRRFLSPLELAEVQTQLGAPVSVGTLSNLRIRRRGMPFVKINGRVYYKIQDVAERLGVREDELLQAVAS